ncbi:MAG: filamentous hemagglutinin N-terminal domain-containing protein [Acidithiobacillus sp.]|nr:filamentous hemagglutinin N-terminal domain-containing protein [Acidithiobacillus sp.]
MKNKRNLNTRVTALGSAVLLALASSAAFAAPTVNQMPGGGAVTAATGGALGTAVTINGGVATGTITGLANPSTIQLQNKGTVITWGASVGGVPVVPDATNPQGFNLGSSAALTFDGKAAGASVLNIDASGAPSVINGMLSGQGATNNVAVFVANANGIVAGSTSRIVLPVGGGLIGGDMSSPTAQQDFIANNKAATAYLDVHSVTGAINFSGAIVGDKTLNVAASNVLLAGSNVTNTGNVYTTNTLVLAGISAPQNTATVNAVANTPVYRLATVATPTTLQTESDTAITPLDLAINGRTVFGNLPGTYTPLVTTAGGTVTNTGSFSSSPGSVAILGTGDVTSGTSGSTDQTVGLFSDSALNIASSGGSVNLYNAVKGYTTGLTLPSITVNAGNNINVNALVVGSAPASIVTTNQQSYLAGNTATIGSSLNSGNRLTNFPISVTGKNVAINANIEAGQNINLTANGTLGVASGVTLTSDSNNGVVGNIVISNGINATTTTIAGTLNAGVTPYIAGPSVRITNSGNTGSDLNISGPINSSSNITITSNGKLELANATAGLSGVGTFTATVFGSSALLSGAITAPTAVNYTANAATTKLTGTMTANAAGSPINLSALNFVGAPGYVGSQLTADFINAIIFGNLNAPIAGNTNWLNNAITAAPFTVTSPVNLTVNAIGASRQSINVKVNGSAIVGSGATVTSWGPVTPITSGFLASGALVGNGGSQLILNATGNMTSPGNFVFPGGVVFKAGGSLNMAGVYNAWTPVAQAYQGVFFEAPNIVANGLVLTNGTSWVNFSTMPAGGSVPNIYQLQPSTNTTNGNGFTANSYNAVSAPGAAHLNTYSSLVTGGPVNLNPMP